MQRHFPACRWPTRKSAAMSRTHERKLRRQKKSGSADQSESQPRRSEGRIGRILGRILHLARRLVRLSSSLMDRSARCDIKRSCGCDEMAGAGRLPPL